MMKKMKELFYGVLSIFVLAPTTAFGATLSEGDNPYFGIGAEKGVGTSNDDFASIIENIILWLLSFVGGLAVLMIIVSGIMYITSGGDEGRVEKAKNWLIYAIVGLIIALLGWVIVKTIINAL